MHSVHRIFQAIFFFFFAIVKKFVEKINWWSRAGGVTTPPPPLWIRAWGGGGTREPHRTYICTFINPTPSTRPFRGGSRNPSGGGGGSGKEFFKGGVRSNGDRGLTPRRFFCLSVWENSHGLAFSRTLFSLLNTERYLIFLCNAPPIPFSWNVVADGFLPPQSPVIISVAMFIIRTLVAGGPNPLCKRTQGV